MRHPHHAAVMATGQQIPISDLHRKHVYSTRTRGTDVTAFTTTMCREYGVASISSRALLVSRSGTPEPEIEASSMCVQGKRELPGEG